MRGNMKRSFCKILLTATIILGFTIVLTPGAIAQTCAKDDVVQAVNKATTYLENEGEQGLQKISKLRFCGDNYVFVNDFKGKTLMHLNSKLIGRVLIGLKDDKGKRFFAEFTKMAMSSKTTKNGKEVYNGAGWVEYRWPKPGQKKFSPKISYIKACMMGDKNVYVGAGIYK